MTPNRRLNPWLEQAWMDRYIERMLDGEELEWFEAYLLDKPELLQTLAADLAVRDAINLKDCRRSEEMEIPPPLAAPATRPAAPRGTRLVRWRSFGIAAAVAVAFASGFLLRSAGPAQEGAFLVVNPTRFVVDTSRGETTEYSVDNAAAGSDLIVVDALVPPNSTEVLLRGNGGPDRPLSVSRDGVVTFLLHRRELVHAAPLSLVIRAEGQEVERPLPMDQLKSGDHR